MMGHSFEATCLGCREQFQAVRGKYLGKRVQAPSSQNPIRYFNR